LSAKRGNEAKQDHAPPRGTKLSRVTQGVEKRRHNRRKDERIAGWAIRGERGEVKR